jgi:hypothetical protein
MKKRPLPRECHGVTLVQAKWRLEANNSFFGLHHNILAGFARRDDRCRQIVAVFVG